MHALARVPPEAIKQLLDIACLLTQASMGFVNLVTETLVAELVTTTESDRQQYAPEETFCAHVVKEPAQPLIVLDASKDSRFCHLAIVTGEQHIRFYAGTAILSPAGVPVGTLCIMDKTARDSFPDSLATGLVTLSAAVTARLDLRQQVETLADERNKFTAFMDSSPTVSFMKDEQGRYTYVNQRFLDSFGMTREALIGKSDADLWSEEIAKPLATHDSWVMQQDRTIELTEAGPPDEHGNTTWWQSYKFVVPGQRKLLGGIALNVSELHRLQTRFRHLASTDALTGLPNRHALNEVLNGMGEQRTKPGELTGVLFMDLDRFKQVNDTLGHQAGDALLIEFADRLRACVRSTDKVFRLAGDEFVVVLEGLHHADEAVRVADKITEAMKASVSIDGQPYQASTSIGIAIRPSGEIHSEALLSMADHALYQAKRAGRGGYALA